MEKRATILFARERNMTYTMNNARGLFMRREDFNLRQGLEEAEIDVLDGEKPHVLVPSWMCSVQICSESESPNRITGLQFTSDPTRRVLPKFLESPVVTAHKCSSDHFALKYSWRVS
jgi:hypothetical protein